MPTKNKNSQTIRNLWTILAQSSSIDRETNNLSVFDIIEEITLQITEPIPDNSAFPINIQLLSFWEREETGSILEVKIKIFIKDPEGKSLSETDGLLRLEEANKRYRFKVQFHGMPITVPGTYKYEICSLEPEKTGVEMIASVPVEIKIASAPAQTSV